ncbi:MAG TPA: gamma-glutamyltransferase, partial [Gemmatimonadaceae bacterium]
MRRSLTRASCAAVLALLAFPITTAAAQQRATPNSGVELLRRMHDAYDGHWFRTLTFVQRTTIRQPDSAAKVSTWYEAMLSPDRLRIDFGDPHDGNGVLMTADSTYVVRGGAITRTAGQGNPFIPFVAGVYTQPVARTARELGQYHIDMTRVRSDTWQGRPVFVVGARDARDLASPQFWVDAERMVLVRMLLPVNRGGTSKTEDIHLDEYVRLTRGWLATKVAMYDGAIARQTEEYSQWRSDIPLDAKLFDATQWSSVPHWTQTTGAPSPSGAGVQSAAYAPDGRLALAIDGDLWVQRSAADTLQWVQVTAGDAWDREPAWSADGTSLIFASDRADGSRLFRVQLSASGAAGEPVRVTTSDEWEAEPAVAPDGTIIFVRGRGPTARLWVRSPDGAEHRLTKQKSAAEHWPAFSSDGTRVAYVSETEDGSRLHVHWLAGDSDRVIVSDRAAEHPAWSPRGHRIAFATRSGPAGVWVTSDDGAYTNLVSDRRAAPAWSSDGRRLALVELPPPPPGYNGDPDRLGDREAGAMMKGAGQLWIVEAPQAPDSGRVLALAVPIDRRAHNAELFDAAWTRTLKLYYSTPDAASRRAQWQRLQAKYRPRALAATTDDELATIVHEMLRARPPLREPATGRAAVSSANPVATEAGLEILRKGGNVVDAAVAVSFALGVVEPDASGVGGYGQMLIRLAPMSQPTLIEFMTRLPEDAIVNEPSVMRNGRYPDDGRVLPNVPGTVAAMYKAWQEYGSHKVKWADLIAPAIRAAEQGYVVSDGLATTLATEREHFLKYEGSRKLFFPNGEPLHAGDTLRNPDLAWTLKQIADSGANAVYRGAVGRRMVADLRGQGNAMRMSDLARYYAAEREPVRGTYRGYTLYSSTPPVSGGATLVAQLNLLEQLKTLPSYTDDPATLHAMIEAWKLVPPSRGRIADPGLWPVNISAFVSKDSARARWSCFDAHHALTPGQLIDDAEQCAHERTRAERADTRLGQAERGTCGGLEPEAGEQNCHRTGTTAFVVADADGNVVAATQTLGTWGGSFYITPGLGFLYNDKLLSYGRDPDSFGSRAPF